MMARARQDEDGFVLVSVVMVLATISAILATAILQSRANANLARTRADLANLQGIADGVTRLVAYDLEAGRAYRSPSLRLPEDGTMVVCQFGLGRTLYVTLEDQGRLIDLNRTPRQAMEEAFRQIGIPDHTALALAAEIVDYRDPDDVPEPGGGAELAQYKALGLPYGPRNGPFLSVDEIGRLPSMTPQIAERLQPALTVYNESGSFDLADLVRRLQPSAAPSLPPAAKPVPSPRQYFRMSVTLAERTARAGRLGVYALGGTRTSTAFLVWQPGITPPSNSATSHPACNTIQAVLAGG